MRRWGLTALGYGLGVQNRKNYQRQYLHVWLANGKNKKKKKEKLMLKNN